MVSDRHRQVTSRSYIHLPRHAIMLSYLIVRENIYKDIKILGMVIYINIYVPRYPSTHVSGEKIPTYVSMYLYIELVLPLGTVCGINIAIAGG